MADMNHKELKMCCMKEGRMDFKMENCMTHSRSRKWQGWSDNASDCIMSTIVDIVTSFLLIRLYSGGIFLLIFLSLFLLLFFVFLWFCLFLSSIIYSLCLLLGNLAQPHALLPPRESLTSLHLLVGTLLSTVLNIQFLYHYSILHHYNIHPTFFILTAITLAQVHSISCLCYFRVLLTSNMAFSLPTFNL